MNLTELLNATILSDDHDDHDHGETNLAKGLTMVILFIISMTSGVLPMLLTKCFNWSDPNRDPRTNLLVSSMLSFGGGALLCTTFMHLLPEIDENISNLQHDGHLPAWEFSVTNLLMAIGFFIIYLVEEFVHTYLRKHQKRQAAQIAQDAFIRGHSARESLRAAALRHNIENEVASKNGIITVSTADLIDHDHLHHHSHTHSHNHHHHSHIPVRRK